MTKPVTQPTTHSTLFEIRNLTKAYPGVVANKDVSFDIGHGEIHALLGENGAGKSTLVKMIYGLVHPTSGTMRFEGKAFAPAKPQEARARGIGMVFQHFSLFDALSVAENIAVGMENPPKSGLGQEIRQVSEAYGLPIEPDHVVGELSAGQRQRVEIIRCLLQNPKLLIMDEPTSVLTPQEVEILFASLRKMQEAGTSILYISHKLEEIRSLCDHATVLRRGEVVGDCKPAEKSARELAEMMVGESLVEPSPSNRKIGDARLVAENLVLHSPSHFGTNIRNVSFSVHAGEILGVAGVAGNGQDEFLALISGEAKPESGRITLDGHDIRSQGPIERRAAGLLAAPEERLGHAAVPEMTLTENAVLTAQKRANLGRGAWIDWSRAEAFTKQVIDVFDVRTSGTHVNANALSGGNLQKFVVGREILQDPEVLVINQPTWGVDVAAAAFIRGRIRELADAGAALIVISQDLDELYELADNVVVLCEGRLSPAAPMASMDIETIGTLMGGEF